MDKMKQIMAQCKCGVHVSINEHRDYYESVDDYMMSRFAEEVKDEIPENDYREMKMRDTVVSVQAYPHTPVGFFMVFHYDLDAALDLMLEALK